MTSAVFRKFRFAAILALAAIPTAFCADNETDAAKAAERPSAEAPASAPAKAAAEPSAGEAPGRKNFASPPELPPLPDRGNPQGSAPSERIEPKENPAPPLPDMPEPEEKKAENPAPGSADAAPDGSPDRPTGETARIRSLNALVAAMVSEDTKLKIEHLLRAIEAEPYGAEAAMIHLVTLCSARQTAAAALERFDALWERCPGSLPLARSGCALHRAVGEDMHGAALLDRSLAELASRGDDDGELFALRLERLDFFCRMQKFAEARKFVNALLPRAGERRGRLLEAALETYAVGALRTEGGHKPAADWLNSAYPCRRAHAETLLALRRCDGDVVSRTICDNRIALYQRHGRHDFALSLAEEFARRFPGEQSQLRICAAAAEAGDIKNCEEMLCVMPSGSNPAIAAALRFRARLRARDYKAAEAFLAKPEAEPIRQRARLELLTAQRNYPGLRDAALELARRGRGEALAVSMSLLVAAEHCRDRAALEFVCKALGSSVETEPIFANAVGYISAMIGGGDLDEASRLVEFALSADPENAAYLDSLACIRLRQGKLDEAEKLIRHALRRADLETSVAVLLEHAADIDAARNRRAEALAGYRGALALADEDSEIDPAELKRKIAALEGKKSE